MTKHANNNVRIFYIYRDWFLHYHIEEFTRVQRNNQLFVLDLVFTHNVREMRHAVNQVEAMIMLSFLLIKMKVEKETNGTK